MDKIVLEIFNEEECGRIVKDIEKNKQHLKLSSEHGVLKISSYEIDSKHFSKEIRELINEKIKEKIEPKAKGRIGMVFGVRYSLDTKSYMYEHYDANSYSCVITLNSDFTGGGTYFPLSGELINPKVGHGLLFRADTYHSYHSANPVNDGVRYVLVIRMETKNSFIVLLKAIYLHFVDKYIQRNKNKLYKKPR